VDWNQYSQLAAKWDQFWTISWRHYGVRQSRSTTKEQTVTPEQEAQLQNLETELAIADKQLRLAQVKKLIAETELDIIGLQQTLQQQLEGTAVSEI
jgi:hypothetical protein